MIHILTRNRAVRDSEGRVAKVVGVNQDITERKKTEEQLMVANFAIQSSISAIGLADMSGKVIFVNDSYLSLWGYDRAEEVLGKPISEFAKTGERADGVQAFRSARGHLGEGVAVRKDGTTFDVQLAINPVRSPDGKLICMMASFVDISNRKIAEARLKESEERYRFLFDSINDAIFVHALTEEGMPGPFIEVNSAACALFGYAREEFAHMTPADICAPEIRESIPLMMKRLQRSKQAVWEGVHVSKEGRRIPVEVSQRVFDFRGRSTVLSAVRDITERKSGRRGPTGNRRAPTRAATVARTGNWELDLSTQVITGSPGASRIYGLPGREWPLSVVRQSPLPEYREMLEKALRALIEENAPYDVEFKARRVDDGNLVDVHSVAEYDHERKTVFGVIQDVTEKKKLEEQLRQAQKMEAVGTLAGGVAHDFNNILSVILGFANLIQMSLGPDDRLTPYVDQIVASSNKAADLTQSLLAFSRKQRITLEPHKIDEVLTSTAKLLKRLLPEDIELRLDLSATDSVVRLDLNQIDQVLMNLATNARDAMPRGGYLSIATKLVTLDEEFRRSHGFGKSGRYALLSVSDTGIGMDEKTKERIFDPFFTTKDVNKGTGLGLASVYGIVTQHEGYIAVSSKLLEGTTFDIYFPIAEAFDRQEAVRTEEVKGGTETILIVEDDPDVRKMMKHILEGSGYATLEAVDGEDGVRMHERHEKEIDLVILDVVMPGKNGKEVMEEITRANSRVKVIFVSGYTGDIVLDKGVQSDSVDFLPKPLSITGLLSKVRDVLDR